MQIVHEHTAIAKGASSHRPGGIRFLSLLQGEENTPGNFHLTLVYADGYVAPRHRHNFDQVRIVMDGAFGFDRGQVQEAGSLGFFPEGTYYTQHSGGPSTTLLLQSGGVSGNGYMSDRQLRSAVSALEARGSFKDGAYTWLDEQGKKHNQDGYEAAWEFVRDQPINYSKPLYDQPVIWRAERFAWEPTGQAGVSIRRFGEFTGKRLSIAQLRLESGAACVVSADERETLLYCISGQAGMGSETLRPISALRLLRGEQVTLVATVPTEFYLYGLMA